MKKSIARALLGGVLTLTTNLTAQKTAPAPLPTPPAASQNAQQKPLTLFAAENVHGCTLEGAAISAHLGVYVDPANLIAAADAGKLKNLPADLETLQDVWRDAALKISQEQIDALDSAPIGKSLAEDVQAWLTKLKKATGLDIVVLPVGSVDLYSGSASCAVRPAPPLLQI